MRRPVARLPLNRGRNDAKELERHRAGSAKSNTSCRGFRTAAAEDRINRQICRLKYRLKLRRPLCITAYVTEV